MLGGGPEALALLDLFSLFSFITIVSLIALLLLSGLFLGWSLYEMVTAAVWEGVEVRNTLLVPIPMLMHLVFSSWY